MFTSHYYILSLSHHLRSIQEVYGAYFEPRVMQVHNVQMICEKGEINKYHLYLINLFFFHKATKEPLCGKPTRVIRSDLNVHKQLKDSKQCTGFRSRFDHTRLNGIYRQSICAGATRAVKQLHRFHNRNRRMCSYMYRHNKPPSYRF